MKILKREQIAQLDQYTIQHEPISSIDLMERASKCFVEALHRIMDFTDQHIVVYCGPGNNGGDGLAIARMLHAAGYELTVVRCLIGQQFSADHLTNWQRLKAKRVIRLLELKQGDALDLLPPADLIIDALFGAGLNRPLRGYWEELVQYLNKQAARRIAVDIPSGLFADQPLGAHTALRADYTISFELPKLSFFAAEHAPYVGQWYVVPIGLSKVGLAAQDSANYWSRKEEIAGLLRVRSRFDHKGNFGHALLIAGSFGSIGAAILSAKAILRSGAGLVTVHLPRCGYEIMQIAFPEAMVSVDQHQHIFTTPPLLHPYRALGIGPGIGQDEATAQGLKHILEASTLPMVLDADALNILARHPD
ncbi:MAG: NAD(P)H-hydrate epimerase, partial [Bacteroidetes bacterium]